MFSERHSWKTFCLRYHISSGSLINSVTELLSSSSFSLKNEDIMIPIKTANVIDNIILAAANSHPKTLPVYIIAKMLVAGAV